METIANKLDNIKGEFIKRDYYIPSIEDIRVGYELQYHNWSMDEASKAELNYDRWESSILEKWQVENFMKYGIGNGVRVPYLTKEQIVAEGWELLKKIEIAGKNRFSDNNFLYFSKGKLISNSESFSKFNLRYKVDTHEVHIISKMRISNDFKSYIKLPTFYGKCPSINEFRYITKLLGI